MADPLTALGVVGNLVQFVDFLMRLLGDAREIHKSAQGSLQENSDVETVATIIRNHQTKLRYQDHHNLRADDKTEDSLEWLCSSCEEIADELLDVLSKLKVQGKRSPWKSIRQAIKNIKGKAAVTEICNRLKRFQEALEFNILVDLREKLDLQSIADSQNFKNLETSTQDIIHAVLQNRCIFSTAIDAQTVALKEIHQKEAVVAALRHQDVKSTILSTVENMNELQSSEHGNTRQEIAQRAACDAANLRAHMDKRSDEIKDLIKATKEAKGAKERVLLAEKANAAVASLVAMELIHGSLMETLAKTNPNRAKCAWKLDSHEAQVNVDERHEEDLAPPITEPPFWYYQTAVASPDVTPPLLYTPRPKKFKSREGVVNRNAASRRRPTKKSATARPIKSKSGEKPATPDAPPLPSSNPPPIPQSLQGMQLPRPPPPMPPQPIRQQSIRIQDITPPKLMDESACLQKLTTYASFYLRKCPPRDGRGRGTWARAEITEERLTQEEIISQVKKLNDKGPSAPDKKKKMGHNMEAQVTTLLDNLASGERDGAFEWSLVQLDAVEKPVSSRGVSLKEEAKDLFTETVRLTIYVKRCPRKDINPIVLFQTIERFKAEAMRSPPLPAPLPIPPPHSSPTNLISKTQSSPLNFLSSSSKEDRKSKDKKSESEFESETDTDVTSWDSEDDDMSEDSSD